MLLLGITKNIARKSSVSSIKISLKIRSCVDKLFKSVFVTILCGKTRVLSYVRVLDPVLVTQRVSKAVSPFYLGYYPRRRDVEVSDRSYQTVGRHVELGVVCNCLLCCLPSSS